MADFKAGDTVVHSTYGSGTVTEVVDKGPAGAPARYYVIETGKMTLWVPVDEQGGSSLHRLSSPAAFLAILEVLRSPGEKVSNNRYERYHQLNERMEKASAEDLCRVLRDLTHRSYSRKLSDSDLRVLKQAQSSLLDEWTLSLGIPREIARSELEAMLKDLQRSKTRPDAAGQGDKSTPTAECLGMRLL